MNSEVPKLGGIKAGKDAITQSRTCSKRSFNIICTKGILKKSCTLVVQKSEEELVHTLTYHKMTESPA